MSAFYAFAAAMVSSAAVTTTSETMDWEDLGNGRRFYDQILTEDKTLVRFADAQNIEQCLDDVFAHRDRYGYDARYAEREVNYLCDGRLYLKLGEEKPEQGKRDVYITKLINKNARQSYQVIPYDQATPRQFDDAVASGNRGMTRIAYNTPGHIERAEDALQLLSQVDYTKETQLKRPIVSV